MDAVALTQALIRCPSVTPADAGALAVLEAALKPMGFSCHRLRFDEDGTPPIDNLYARIGTGGPHFCFAGHSDVVPSGENWSHDPFSAVIADGVLFGRGAADMKSAVAAFAAAAARHLEKGPLKGSISLLITGDEEGPAINGTAKMLAWMKKRGERIDHCVVGEPTSTARAGDTLKIGRRGSINFEVTVRGSQGHVGYPHKANNPIPAVAGLVTALTAATLDGGNDHFDPSTLAFTNIDVGNPAANVIPGEARAAFNIRFNDQHTPESLIAWVKSHADHMAAQTGCAIALRHSLSGVSFLTKPGKFTDLVRNSVARVTGEDPIFSTSGGTSDARFIKDHCPVVELGLAGTTMHKTDECVTLREIETLTAIYTELLADYFAAPPV